MKTEPDILWSALVYKDYIFLLPTVREYMTLYFCLFVCFSTEAGHRLWPRAFRIFTVGHPLPALTVSPPSMFHLCIWLAICSTGLVPQLLQFNVQGHELQFFPLLQNSPYFWLFDEEEKMREEVEKQLALLLFGSMRELRAHVLFVPSSLRLISLMSWLACKETAFLFYFTSWSCRWWL